MSFDVRKSVSLKGNTTGPTGPTDPTLRKPLENRAEGGTEGGTGPAIDRSHPHEARTGATWDAETPLWKREALLTHVRDLLPSRGAVGVALWLRWGTRGDGRSVVYASTREIAARAAEQGDLVLTPLELLGSVVAGERGRLDAGLLAAEKRRARRWTPELLGLPAALSDAPDDSETWWPGVEGWCPGHWMAGGWTLARWLHELGADLEAAHIEGEVEPRRWAEGMRF